MLVQEEAAMLRRALNESMRRVASLNDEGSAQVDRRIVVKLLVTFFERGQSQEVLSLMARILAFSGNAAACTCFAMFCVGSSSALKLYCAMS